MNRLIIFLCVVFSVPNAYQASKNGLLELDEHSFYKVLNKFDAALVKFDVAYPYGDKHDAFLALAFEARDVDELLVADVNVKDYGEKDNEALAAKYGANKDNFPVVKLFLKGKSEPLTFDSSKGFTTAQLQKFVRENTGLYLSLPGCIKEFDQLADKFVAADEKEREKILQEVEKEQKTLPEKHAASGEVYKTIMKKIIEKGDSFIKTEKNRVKKIVAGKLSDEKKKTLNTRLNILQSFQLALKTKSKQKEEL